MAESDAGRMSEDAHMRSKISNQAPKYLVSACLLLVFWRTRYIGCPSFSLHRLQRLIRCTISTIELFALIEGLD